MSHKTKGLIFPFILAIILITTIIIQQSIEDIIIGERIIHLKKNNFFIKTATNSIANKYIKILSKNFLLLPPNNKEIVFCLDEWGSLIRENQCKNVFFNKKRNITSFIFINNLLDKSGDAKRIIKNGETFYLLSWNSVGKNNDIQFSAQGILAFNLTKKLLKVIRYRHAF